MNKLKKTFNNWHKATRAKLAAENIAEDEASDSGESATDSSDEDADNDKNAWRAGGDKMMTSFTVKTFILGYFHSLAVVFGFVFDIDPLGLNQFCPGGFLWFQNFFSIFWSG